MSCLSHFTEYDRIPRTSVSGFYQEISEGNSNSKYLKHSYYKELFGKKAFGHLGKKYCKNK